MTWLALRQFRAQVISGGVLLAVLLAAVLLTWAQVQHMATSSGFADCSGTACPDAAAAFLTMLYDGVPGIVHAVGLGALFVMPALSGVFWGAPLVARELETGTYRMVLSQSVGRHRWLLVKLLVGCLSAAAGAGLFSLVLTLWARDIDAAGGDRITPLVFPARGVVPIGYAALAFVAGVTLGLVLRRTVVAMALTLLVVAGLQVAAPFGLRPLLAGPITTTVALDVGRLDGIGMDVATHEMHLSVNAAEPNAWTLSSTVVTVDGEEFTGPADVTKCGRETSFETCREWIAAQHLQVRTTDVPGSKFWSLQWRECASLLVLSLGLGWFALWWIRRRLV